ncbi:MAG: NADH:ubiquinone reductase (Na(+)-transporting) subunit C [Bacteroidales bacterium]
MNTNNNIYTIIYTTVVVILVAAILAFTSMALKPKQEANVKAEAISQMLTAAQFAEKSELEALGNDKILSKYVESIDKALIVNGKGEIVDSLDKAKSQIYTESDLKAQNYLIKKGNADALRLPVFIFNKEGSKVTVIPCYGAGLWGPIWGYLAFNEDLTTFAGAYFDHASETPGLGAKIKDDPAFRAEFVGKTTDLSEDRIFNIVKGGAKEGQTNAIDAITGATMTSKGLDVAINLWLQAYKPYLESGVETIRQKAQAAAALAQQADSLAVSDSTIVAE